MKCLIIAAGQGSRLRQRAESKPLVPLLGIPLIERVMHAAMAGGVTEFHVVSGFQGPRLRSHLDLVRRRDGMTIHHVLNPRWHDPNGISVLAARGRLSGPFLLLMSDHLFEPAIVRGLIRQPLPADGLVLAVDRRIHNPHIDLSDVTRVRCEADRIVEIGKGLDDYNAFDTGIFYCTDALFDAIDESIAEHRDASLSGGVRVLASLSRAMAADIGGRYWLDIDDSRAFAKAEVALQQGLDGQRSVRDPARSAVI